MDTFYPKITIVTASFNSEKTIRQTIESVVYQTYLNIEYIVIDGGSTDGTVDIIKEYKDKIAFWISEPDKGVYDAFNKGVQHASGEYVQFLGSDDCLYEKSTIEKVVHELSNGEIDILSAGVWVVDDNTKQEFFVDGTKAENENYDYTMIPHQGMFARRDLLLRYPFDTSYCIAADYLFFLTCYFETENNIKYIKLPAAFYSLGGISADTANQRYLLENERVRKSFNLPIKRQENVNKDLKEMIKNCLKIMHIFGTVRYVCNYYVRRTWRTHHCNWSVCRWCANRRD